MVRFLAETSSSYKSDLDAPVASSYYHVYKNGKSEGDRAILNAVNELLKHVVLKTKFTEGQKASSCADGVVTYSIVDIDDFNLERVSARVASDVFLERQGVRVAMKYDRFVAQLRIV